jgi:hypothetical protein
MRPGFAAESTPRAGMPVAQIASAFYASPEYFKAAKQSNHRIWVPDLCQKLLFRKPDTRGLNGWVRALDAGMQRDEFAYGFYKSLKTLSARVNSRYLRFWTLMVSQQI